MMDREQYLLEKHYKLTLEMQAVVAPFVQHKVKMLALMMPTIIVSQGTVSYYYSASDQVCLDTIDSIIAQVTAKYWPLFDKINAQLAGMRESER